MVLKWRNELAITSYANLSIDSSNKHNKKQFSDKYIIDFRARYSNFAIGIMTSDNRCSLELAQVLLKIHLQ